jgi:hypothetical protein
VNNGAAGNGWLVARQVGFASISMTVNYILAIRVITIVGF